MENTTGAAQFRKRATPAEFRKLYIEKDYIITFMIQTAFRNQLHSRIERAVEHAFI
jgi:hypothetical protein